MIKVKICGITNIEDALAVISYGADAIGFLVGQVHYSTGSFITPEQAAEIVDALPPYCSTVLVTHTSHTDEVVGLARKSKVNTIQLHGETTPEEALEIKKELPYIKTYKVVHVFDESAIEEAKRYEKVVDGIILDTAIKETGQVGGTGKVHDWSISHKLVQSVSSPVILAGGLNPDNVIEAINAVQPFAVDVNSGVTNKDGTKDLEKVKIFVQRVKSL